MVSSDDVSSEYPWGYVEPVWIFIFILIILFFMYYAYLVFTDNLPNPIHLNPV